MLRDQALLAAHGGRSATRRTPPKNASHGRARSTAAKAAWPEGSLLPRTRGSLGPLQGEPGRRGHVPHPAASLRHTRLDERTERGRPRLAASGTRPARQGSERIQGQTAVAPKASAISRSRPRARRHAVAPACALPRQRVLRRRRRRRAGHGGRDPTPRRCPPPTARSPIAALTGSAGRPVWCGGPAAGARGIGGRTKDPDPPGGHAPHAPRTAEAPGCRVLASAAPEARPAPRPPGSRRSRARPPAVAVPLSRQYESPPKGRTPRRAAPDPPRSRPARALRRAPRRRQCVQPSPRRRTPLSAPPIGACQRQPRHGAAAPACGGLPGRATRASPPRSRRETDPTPRGDGPRGPEGQPSPRGRCDTSKAMPDATSIGAVVTGDRAVVRCLHTHREEFPWNRSPWVTIRRGPEKIPRASPGAPRSAQPR